VNEILDRFRPGQAWIVAPDLPPVFKERAVERESDFYYRLDLGADIPAGRLARIVAEARPRFRIEHASEMTPHHQALIMEFKNRPGLHPRVAKLADAMPDYARACPEATVLNAWDSQGRLAAFYVADFSADRFAAYVLGCFSKSNFTPRASDVLMAELVDLSKRRGKEYLHLGLGVSPGIRRFKEKWGGVPSLGYEMVKILWKKPSILEILTRGR
jgi:hypothetical protein